MNGDNENNPRDYIGDGVYVEFDGYAVTLRTERLEGEHWIMLEPEVLQGLNRFWLKMHPPTATDPLAPLKEQL